MKPPSLFPPLLCKAPKLAESTLVQTRHSTARLIDRPSILWSQRSQQRRRCSIYLHKGSLTSLSLSHCSRFLLAIDLRTFADCLPPFFFQGPAGQTPFPTLVAMSSYFPPSQQEPESPTQEDHLGLRNVDSQSCPTNEAA